MHIVADENIPLLDGFFGALGSITRLPGRRIDRDALMQADVLLVRSVTRVTAEMLAGTPVRFVGTCTIGTDHLDLSGLATAGIQLASAPGCNARGVVEYVLSCLLTLSERTGLPWRERVVGIIGVGEVGGRLASTLAALGVQTLLCDPPRAEQGASGLVDLQTLLESADVISCHVPLSDRGAHATRHLLDRQRLTGLPQGAWLINSSRGPVIDNAALLEVLQTRPDLQVALDVWEYEPDVDVRLAALCALATPHIAGYSLDGKLRGTAQIYQALCAYLARPAELHLADLASSAGRTRLAFDPTTEPDWLLSRALRWVYDVRDDDARLREMLQRCVDAAARRSGFDQLRRDYPLRREMNSVCVSSEGLTPEAQTLLGAAGCELDQQA
ncbi:MAG: 4-phosphoerythronate dehydrogenase PdxB [Gammaproteobacteria bacterium HGW-Gammaproteobacteria-6]|nr:MAG: 4-phosphoerythronate dehydrogenase PdxB [Gammaproteobacteria bacterium HGW-Gammaproteobacteria-6]